MKTTYVKARLYLMKYDNEKDEPKKFKLNFSYLEDFRKRGLGDLEYVLNNHLLDYALNKQAFAYCQELQLEDLAQYCTLPFVKSILPIHIGIEIDFRDYDNFMEKECPIYLYFKITSKDHLSSTGLKKIMDEISGQLSDGWGEGFEQKDLDLSGYIYDNISRHVIYTEDKEYSLSATAYCQEKVQLEVVPEIRRI